MYSAESNMNLGFWCISLLLIRMKYEPALHVCRPSIKIHRSNPFLPPKKKNNNKMVTKYNNKQTTKLYSLKTIMDKTN